MNLPLLHGSLGWGDELIFVSVAVIFLVIMAVQWVVMRAADDEDNATKPNQTSENPPNDDTETFHLD